MDPTGNWAQDVIVCHHCETPVLPTECMYCDICDNYLCSLCVGKHLSDESTEHKVVPFKKRGSTTKCQIHSSKICELFCEQCGISICNQCVSSKEHKGHDIVDVVETLDSQRKIMQRDLQELEQFIFPKYQETASNITVQKEDLNGNSQILTRAIEKHGEDLHRAIDTMIKKLESNLDEMDSKHLALLNKQENEIMRTISEIKQSIADLKKLLISNDFSLVFAYKSKNIEFRKLPPKITATLPSFIPQEVNKEHVYELFGSLSPLSFITEEHGYTMESSGAELSTLERQLIDVPRIIEEINTQYNTFCRLRCVSCLSDEEIWMCGNDSIVGLYNLQGEIMKSMQSQDPHRWT